jgi:hypothetical protein
MIDISAFPHKKMIKSLIHIKRLTRVCKFFINLLTEGLSEALEKEKHCLLDEKFVRTVFNPSSRTMQN